MPIAAAHVPRIEKHPLEGTSFGAIVVTSAILWLVVIFAGPGLVILPMLALSLWVGQELMLAASSTSAVRVGPGQFPHLWSAYQEVGKRLGVADLPPLYLQQEGGVINAFAAKAARKRQIVIKSGLVDALIDDDRAMQFILAHELGHHEAKHTSLLKALLLTPLDMIVVGGLLHTALSRGQEFTADRYGVVGCGDVAAAERAMLVLMAGRLGRTADVDAVERQGADLTAWNHLLEMGATHPNCLRRIAQLRIFGQLGQPGGRVS